MTYSVTDDNLDRIRSDLSGRGLSYDPLMDDLLDHVCCMVEDEMESGSDFDSSYGKIISSIKPDNILKIQHQTILLLDKKFQRMKNFTYLFGISSAIIAIIGALFKKMHWPGAGILLTVGIVFVLLVFLPLYFTISYREQTERKSPIYAIVGYLTLSLMLAGALFKIQHWPGAGVLIEVGLGMLIIGFIPLYIVNAFQRGGSNKISLPYIVMLLVGIAIVVVFTNVNMSKNVLDAYKTEAINNEIQVEVIKERTAYLMEIANDSSKSIDRESILMIHDRARSLQVMIAMMQEGLTAHVGQAGVGIADLKEIDNRGAGKQAIVDNGSGRAFALEAEKFIAMLLDVVKDPTTQNQIKDHLEFTGDVWPFEYGSRDVANDPLIKNYFKLSDASKGIALSEYVAISYLLHDR